MTSIKWNPKVKLILSDVDETIADLYLPADKRIINELIILLQSGISIFFITGQSLSSVKWRITDKFKPELRNKILVSHCSGAEVWGFDKNGKALNKPFYSLYNQSLNDDQKNAWRKIINQLIDGFKLKVYPTMPVSDFKNKSNNNPLAIMLEDRGPQITFEVVNGYTMGKHKALDLDFKVPKTNDLYDLRVPIAEKASVLLNSNNIPITPRLAGVFAIDFVIKDVTKETSVKNALQSRDVLNHLQLNKKDVGNFQNMEIWGDKFSEIHGGTDRFICLALDRRVRAIDFRQENPDEFPKGYNISIWDGKKHLHEGLLEYLQSRNYNDL